MVCEKPVAKMFILKNPPEIPPSKQNYNPHPANQALILELETCSDKLGDITAQIILNVDNDN